MLTLTAIGYGRITPATSIGKMACIISAIVGRLAISAVTANVLQLTGLFELEERTHNYVIKCAREREMKSTACRVIQACWRWYRIKERAYEWSQRSFTIVNTDFEMQQTEIFHRESHAPFLLRMYLFDMIGKMRIARLKQRKRRIDHSGVIHELDMSRKGSFVLQEISNKFVNAQNLITNVLGQKKSKYAYRGALYVYTDVGPKWLNKIVKKIKEFGKTVDKKTDEVSMKRKQLQYMELLNISRGNSPSNSPNTHSSKSSTNNKKMAQM